MSNAHTLPSLDQSLPELKQFIVSLAHEYEAGNIQDWSAVDRVVKAFFTPQRMDKVDAVIPHWQKMASYFNGTTLTHVLCAFIGLSIMPEFLEMTRERQEIANWIVLFHDIEKETVNGERDQTHGFRSAVTTAEALPRLGFAITPQYNERIEHWSQLTRSAIKTHDKSSERAQDNAKLPDILLGIESMFGKHSAADLIVKGVLLHMSINTVKDWTQAAPLHNKEIKKYLDKELTPFVKVMMLADCEGWSLFYPEVRLQQREETLEVFEKITMI